MGVAPSQPIPLVGRPYCGEIIENKPRKLWTTQVVDQATD